MTDHAAWQKAFRKGDASSVVKALCVAWQELVDTSPDTFNPDEREPRLTELLCEYLRSKQALTKLTGDWGYEGRFARLVRKTAKGLIVVRRRRTDIRYFSDRENPPLDLIFEFKKLSRTKRQLDNYVGEEGMLRFITGEYAQGQPVALMVGILVIQGDDAVSTLVQYLNSLKARTSLQMELIAGQQTTTPSQFFPSHAAFDTGHRRSLVRTPPAKSIVLSHLFLDFSNGI